ncbi:RagB/SusD family nutrient uptake outer membrane protein [Niabella beijingensis]|uniref:RagB/SusD family nutrient uptake outer membrane protein n=1 Tax=Niabella beijingensis TaxID=2872700 RepID=UPI001CBC08D2|nr:RagB/SusD family nutrient uptake outer membrane protein [Niabella beijingensis]MBZ4190288.1 RagB/SusD family nutrient uptake outer membrane protein [Niabella beijingensis]
MKRSYYIIVLLTLFFSAGCKRFLDTPYDNRVRPTLTEQYAQVLTDAYPARHEMFTDILTDDYQYYATLAQASINERFLPMYLYKDEYPQNIPTGPENAYSEFYAKIYRANVVIEGVMSSERGTEEYKAAVMGEALLIRAYCHFMLVNLFSQHYDPATADKDLGIGLVTAVSQENKKLIKRNSVKEVYDQVEKDATEGIAFLKKGQAYVSKNPYHFSIASANAFMTRMELYKGNWDAAVKYADAVIAEKGRIVRDLAADLAVNRKYNREYYATMFMDPPTHPNILMNCYSLNLGFLTPTGYTLCGFFPTDEVRAQFKSTPYGRDRRDSILVSVGTVIDNQVVCTKYNTQPNNPNSFVRAAYFTTDEVLLNRAEAVLRGTANPVASALDDLNTLRAARYTNYTPLTTAVSRDSLIRIVVAERRKEFLNEGLRWFDVKRFKIPVEHVLGRGLPVAASIGATDLRKALQIPLTEQLGNPGIVLNPR